VSLPSPTFPPAENRFGIFSPWSHHPGGVFRRDLHGTQKRYRPKIWLEVRGRHIRQGGRSPSLRVYFLDFSGWAQGAWAGGCADGRVEGGGAAVPYGWPGSGGCADRGLCSGGAVIQARGDGRAPRAGSLGGPGKGEVCLRLVPGGEDQELGATTPMLVNILAGSCLLLPPGPEPGRLGPWHRARGAGCRQSIRGCAIG
jgi:hypothetical protein